MNADGSDLVVLPTAPGGTRGRSVVHARRHDASSSSASNAETGDDALEHEPRRQRPAARIRPGSAPPTPTSRPTAGALSFVCAPTAGRPAGTPHQPHRRRQPLQLTPFSFDVGDQAGLGARRPAPRRSSNNADLPNPGDSANIATIRPDGTDLRFLTHYQGGEVNALRRLLLARRPLDRLPPRGPRPASGSTRCTPTARHLRADPRPLELRAAIHRLGPAARGPRSGEERRPLTNRRVNPATTKRRATIAASAVDERPGREPRGADLPQARQDTNPDCPPRARHTGSPVSRPVEKCPTCAG